MIDEQKQYVKKLIKQANLHDDWVAIMKFGMANLIKDESFLYELVRSYAERRPQPADAQIDLSKEIKHLFDELGLEFSISIKFKSVSRGVYCPPLRQND